MGLKSIIARGADTIAKALSGRRLGGTLTTLIGRIGEDSGFNEEAFVEEGYAMNPIVYAAISTKANAAQAFNINVETRADGKWETEEAHPLSDLLMFPNRAVTWYQFSTGLITYMDVFGEAFVLQVSPNRENIEPDDMELWLVDPRKVEPDDTTLGELPDYKIRKTDDSKPEKFDFNEVLHLRRFNPDNRWKGMPPLKPAAKSTDSHNEATQHNYQLTKNRGSNSSLLTVSGDSSLTPEQRETVRERVENRWKGSKNAGRPIVLPASFEYTDLGATNRDMEYIDGKNLSAREIAHVFGVPSQLIGDPENRTYSNSKAAEEALYKRVLKPEFEYLTLEMTRWLREFFGDDFRFALDTSSVEVLQPDRTEKIKAMTAAGWMSTNEKRAELDLPPVSELDDDEPGEMVFVDRNVLPLSDLQAGPVPGTAEPPPPEEEEPENEDGEPEDE